MFQSYSLLGVNVTLFGKKVYADIIKLRRSCWDRKVSSIQYLWLFIRRGNETPRQMPERQPCEVKDGSNAATCQGMPEAS